jgi:hypothetical protein
MADEAFALSPISARAAQPNEEDYAAIHEAFMETSRGRWFLGEYAKRNRNADTRLVLDAVARIEESLAAQKEAAAEADLAEALAAIRHAIGEAQAAANAGLAGLDFEGRLAPITKGVRVIREISWRWREIGADGRICDILDSQTAAIENSASQISVAEAHTAIDQAFASIEARLDAYSRGGDTPAQARQAAEPGDDKVVPFPAPAEEAFAATAEPVVAEVVAELTEAAAPVAEPVEEAAPITAVAETIEVISDEAAADAHDDAVLDLIAAEMSAPDPFHDDIEIAAAELLIAEPPFAEPAPDVVEAVAPGLEPIAAAIAPAIQPGPAAALAPAAEPAPPPAQVAEAEISIGSAVIASGILTKPALPASDPLAPIRRMSQAERIAFFS